MKKAISLLLAVFLLCLCAMPVASLDEVGVVSVKLNSNVAGLTKNDTEKLFEIKGGNVVYQPDNAGPVYICNYAGTSDSGKLVAGRTYTVYYSLVAAEGYELPDQINDGDVLIETEKGVRVIRTSITSGSVRGDDGILYKTKGLSIFAELKVDGNFFQRFIGRIHDIILKIKAWSLY